MSDNQTHGIGHRLHVIGGILTPALLDRAHARHQSWISEFCPLGNRLKYIRFLFLNLLRIRDGFPTMRGHRAIIHKGSCERVWNQSEVNIAKESAQVTTSPLTHKGPVPGDSFLAGECCDLLRNPSRAIVRHLRRPRKFGRGIRGELPLGGARRGRQKDP